jgi:GNAT superfamily N-acetyltransferase
MRRHGIGQLIVKELFRWGAELGCCGAWVATETDNGAAIGLYERAGAQGTAMMYFEYQLASPTGRGSADGE